MPRGPMLRTKLKKEAKAVAVVKIAEQMALDKLRKKRKLHDVIAEHIGKMVDRLQADDVIKLAGWATTTYMVHELLRKSEEIVSKVVVVAKDLKTGELFEPFYVLNLLMRAIGLKEEEEENKAIRQAVRETYNKVEMQLWLLSAGIGALIILFGPAIVEASGGIVGVAKLFLA